MPTGDTHARPEASEADITAALRAAHALEFVSDLPDGLETVVGERGVKLSGGQRQRLGIARLLLAEPTVLLLDEPTSAVDSQSEAQVVAALGELMQGRTALMVTHRLSLAHDADRVLVIEAGQVVQDGRLAELQGLHNSVGLLDESADVTETAPS